MAKRSGLAYRDKNHTGWWIFCEVQQWVSQRQKTLSPRSRCLVWENTRIIRAESREEAYDKAMKLGEQGHPSKTTGGEWRFAGISMLLPIYEPLEDGSEILWTAHKGVSMAKIKQMVKNKRRLAIFGDREADK